MSDHEFSPSEPGTHNANGSGVEPHHNGTNGDGGGAPGLRLPTGAPEGTTARGRLTQVEEEPATETSALENTPDAPAAATALPSSIHSADDFAATLDTTEVSYETDTNAFLDRREEFPSTVTDDDFERWNEVLDTPYDAYPGTVEEERLFDTEPLKDSRPEWSREVEDSRYDGAPPLNLGAGDGGEPPEGGFDEQVPSPYDENSAARDREMDLIEHLAELRTRLMWSVGTIAVLMIFTWNMGNEIQNFLSRPILQALKNHGVENILQIIGPTDAFMIYFQITFVSALLLGMPMILFQAWRFIEPALTNNERRYTSLLVPFSVGLFILGSALGYYVSPLFFNFFLQFVPENVQANLSFSDSIVLLAKMLLVFGVCFQIPVVTIFLIKAGVVSRNVLIEYWRHAVIVIFTVVAVITPTWDPLTLMVCALPSCILYLFSIWLVKWL